MKILAFISFFVILSTVFSSYPFCDLMGKSIEECLRSFFDFTCRSMGIYNPDANQYFRSLMQSHLRGRGMNISIFDNLFNEMGVCCENLNLCNYVFRKWDYMCMIDIIAVPGDITAGPPVPDRDDPYDY